MSAAEKNQKPESSLLSVVINNAINRTFPYSTPPHITHSFSVPSEFRPNFKKVYPKTLSTSDNTTGVVRDCYDLGAETINNWLLTKACDLVFENLPPGISQSLKNLSPIYGLDRNPGYKELEKMRIKLKITDLKSIINSTLFSHDPGNITSLWNIYRGMEDLLPLNLAPDDFILTIGRLASPDKEKTQSKMQKPTPNWIGDFEAVAQGSGGMLKPEWLNIVILAELIGSAAILSTQPVPAAILLGSSIMNTGLSVLDEIYKSLYMRSISKTDFGIRKIEWNKEVK